MKGLIIVAKKKINKKIVKKVMSEMMLWQLLLNVAGVKRTIDEFIVYIEKA